MPDSLTEIGGGAFANCIGLTEIHLPDSLTKIGDYAFYGCSGLTEIHLPDSLTEIGMGAFEGCDGLRKITYHRKTESIVKIAFYEQWRSLEKIVLD